MNQRKLNRASDQRTALLRNQVSEFLWYGKLTTTAARGDEVARIAEKLITLAMGSYDDTVKVTKQVKESKYDSKTKQTVVSVIEKEFTNDGPKKLAARRTIMRKTRDLQELKAKKETKTAYKERTRAINHPLVEKIFNVYAPKYAKRAEELGQGGGYVRTIKLGLRRGDAAEMVILMLV